MPLMPKSYEPVYLLHDCNFLVSDDTRSDMAVDADPIQCYKFVSHQIASRILIKIDRDLLDT